MGLPAKRMEPRVGRASGPRLRLVTSAPRRPARKRCTVTARAAAARQGLLTFVVVMAVIALLGMGRVWLSSIAAEASLESGRLRTQIKEARYEGDMLEVRQSALGSPSRIRAIAGAAFGMAPAESVTYLDVTPKRTGVPAPVVAAAPTGSGFDTLLESAMRLAAGEAQVLLVGDVGLASTQ